MVAIHEDDAHTTKIVGVVSQWEVTNQVAEASLVVGASQVGFANLEDHASLVDSAKPDNCTKADNGVLPSN